MNREYDILYMIKFKGVYPSPNSGYHVSIDGGKTILYKSFNTILEDIASLGEYKIKIKHEWLTDKEVETLKSIDNVVLEEE